MSYSDVWPKPPDDYMRKSEYDVDKDLLVDNAENLSDGANESTAQEVREHLDANEIHREINDLQISNIEVWSSNKINAELSQKADNNHEHDGTDMLLDTSTFDSVLSPNENTPQKMAEVVDDSIRYNLMRRSFRINLKGA